VRRFLFALSLAFCLASLAAASAKRRPHAKSSHAEIAAVARVETAPQRIVHRNRRTFEELDVTILSAEQAPEGDAGGENLVFDTAHPVHVVHDLTCGGSWVEAKPGDRIEVKGEYVHPPRGGDLIHFTHPAGATEGCGRGGAHPDGYLRLARPAATAEAAGAPNDVFWATVRPVVARRCAPCHEKGGKMYARLPFDDPNVLSSHADGVRRRLKGDDLAAFERWLTTLSSSASDVTNPKS
jgi:hypothetical protein